MHSNWRDCDAWRQEGLPMSTTSNEACKFYDLTLSQLVGWYEDKQYGGLTGSVSLMVNADSDFVLGLCLKNGMEILGSNANLNSANHFKNVQDLAVKANSVTDLTKRERMHVKAVQLLQDGKLSLATDYWEQILIEHPEDMMAIKFLSSAYFYLGESREMHQSVARVLPLWKVSRPLYNRLYGMYAFGLAQDNFLDQAERNAHKGLEMHRGDVWATHAICHVNEYRSSFDDGIKFLLDTELDWKDSTLASHQYWHMALYYLEKNEIENVLDILDTKIMTDLSSPLNIINASSLLVRLKLNDFKKSELLINRWLTIKENCEDRIDKHGFMYGQSHVALTYAACGSSEDKWKFFNALDIYISSTDFGHGSDELVKTNGLLSEFNLKERENENFLKILNKELYGLYESIFYYEQGDFDKCVELLYPIRQKVRKIGGSNAQRDVFSLLLIDAAFKSNNSLHKKLGAALLNERLLNRPNSDLTKRIAHRFFADE